MVQKHCRDILLQSETSLHFFSRFLKKIFVGFLTSVGDEKDVQNQGDKIF